MSGAVLRFGALAVAVTTAWIALLLAQETVATEAAGLDATWLRVAMVACVVWMAAGVVAMICVRDAR